MPRMPSAPPDFLTAKQAAATLGVKLATLYSYACHGTVLGHDNLEELQDRHLRLAAEFENYRKRTRRELAEMRRRSQADLVAGLLDVLDDLTRVAHAAPPAPDATVQSLMDGVGLVEAKMRKALGDAGLARIEAHGQPFDPNVHEALATRPTTDPSQDDIICNVIVDGYTFDEILVRPARVQVAKYGPPSSPSEEEAVEGDDA